MNGTAPTTRAPQPPRLLFVPALAALCLWPLGCAQTPEPAVGPAYAQPQAAVDAMVTALRSGDPAQLNAALGPSAADLLYSGDPVADREAAAEFLVAYDAGHSLVTLDDGVLVLTTGDDWPFPIPLVQGEDGWRLDLEAGREEVLNRRVGRNELDAIQVCFAVVDAQHEFALLDPDGDGWADYANRVFSTPGQRDGLYWPVDDGEELSPLGAGVADAEAQGYTPGTEDDPTPFHGYYYRLLRRQGPHAPSGEMDYQRDDGAVIGFALLAYPARYGRSGVMTFVTNQSGTLYQADLGPGTADLAPAIEAFDPDPSVWEPVAVALDEEGLDD